MTAVSRFKSARISFKQSIAICKEIKGKNVAKAKQFLENLIYKKVDIKGRYHPTAARQILQILETAVANAKVKKMNEEKLFVKIAKADTGDSFIKPRSRWGLRGRKAKSANIFIELGER
jgi:large subunit ribosomal protein L22